MNKVIDATDSTICKLLSSNAKMTMKELGVAIFLCEDRARKRRNNLEKRGIIERHYTISHDAEFKKTVLTHHHIKLVSNAGDNLKRFIDKSKGIPQITNCLHVAADNYDFTIIIESPSLHENYRILIFNLCKGLEIDSIINAVVLSETKRRGSAGFLSGISDDLNNTFLFLSFLSQFFSTEAMSSGLL
jgi:Lrp/AsnC family leucine-responsive transcriptional regulator